MLWNKAKASTLTGSVGIRPNLEGIQHMKKGIDLVYDEVTIFIKSLSFFPLTQAPETESIRNV